MASGWLEGFPPPSTAACFASSASGGGLLLAKPRLLGDKGLKRSAIIILFGYLLTQPLQESGHDIVLFNLLPIALKAIHWLPFLGLQRATTHFCKLWQMFPPSHSFLPSLCLGFGWYLYQVGDMGSPICSALFLGPHSLALPPPALWRHRELPHSYGNPALAIDDLVQGWHIIQAQPVNILQICQGKMRVHLPKKLYVIKIERILLWIFSFYVFCCFRLVSLLFYVHHV